MFICSHCGEISSVGGYKRAANAKAWALGHQQANGFHIRKVVWGLLMANMEKRIDEEIRAVLLLIEPQHKRRSSVPEIKGANDEQPTQTTPRTRAAD
jgi:hypothetical protein